MNKKCSKINITDIMNLLAVTVTLSIQTCIVRLYNVKKKFTTQYVLSKKKLKRSILVFQGNSTFFFSLLCSAKAKKMNVTIGSQAQQYYVKCWHIDKSYCHTEKRVNQFSFSIKLWKLINSLPKNLPALYFFNFLAWEPTH